MRSAARALGFCGLTAWSIAPNALAQESAGGPTQEAMHPDIPAMLNRVAPSIVKIRRGDEWGTGVIFGNARYVVTAYTLVNASGDLLVIASDGKVRGARVVAWSEEDGLAVLELDSATPGAPLAAAHDAPFAGMPLVMLYHPRDPSLDADKAAAWDVPVARFARVGRTYENDIDVDVNLGGLSGNQGAPMVNEQGELAAVISYHKEWHGRISATSVNRVMDLIGKVGRQGEFSPDVRVSWSAGFFATPVYERSIEGREPRRFVGGGFEWGACLNWFCPNVPIGFYSSFPRRVDATTVESLLRIQLDLDAELKLSLSRHARIFLGPGLALSLSEVYVTSATADNGVQTDEHAYGRVRASFTLGGNFADFMLGDLFVRDVFTFGSDSEVRFDVGIVFGR